MAALRVVLVSYPIAMVLLGLLAAVVGGTLSTPAIVWGLLCGVSQAFGVWWFYAALGSGPISVVSPLTAVLVAAVPVGVGLALGERPGAVAGAGTVLALLAVVLVSRETTDEDVSPHRFTTTVAWLTVGSGLAFGMNFVLIHQAPAAAGLWPLFFARLSATAIVLAVAPSPAISARRTVFRFGWPWRPRCWTPGPMWRCCWRCRPPCCRWRGADGVVPGGHGAAGDRRAT